mmetsp:Transcript_83441/g.232743  ORF Transcript_83441/g.232743 Transcript_83441/m.232743 type:complete len:221 (+) Transcript_83441:717-1379(+)
MASPSRISDSSLSFACQHCHASLQSTGLPSAASSAASMASSSFDRKASDSRDSAACIMSLTSLHHETGLSFSGASGDSYTNVLVTELSQKTSKDQEHIYLKTVEENCFFVAVHSEVCIARWRSSWIAGSVQRINGVCPRSFFAKTSTPCDMMLLTHSVEPPAAAWCNTVFPMVSFWLTSNLWGGAMSSQSTFVWPLNAAQCRGVCGLLGLAAPDSSGTDE